MKARLSRDCVIISDGHLRCESLAKGGQVMYVLLSGSDLCVAFPGKLLPPEWFKKFVFLSLGKYDYECECSGEVLIFIRIHTINSNK